jgi:hypothetical protein
MTKVKIQALACGVVFLLSSTLVRSGVIYSNFGPDPGYNNANHYGLGDGNSLNLPPAFSSYTGSVYLATSFTPAAGAPVGALSVAVDSGFTDPPGDSYPVVEAFLYASAGAVPGSPLLDFGSISVSNSSAIYSLNAPSSSAITLTGGRTYWLVLTQTAQGDENHLNAYWDFNNLAGSRPGYAASMSGSAPWVPGPINGALATAPAFAVYDTPVPEPSAFVMGVLAMFPLGLQLIRRRSQRRPTV